LKEWGTARPTAKVRHVCHRVIRNKRHPAKYSTTETYAPGLPDTYKDLAIATETVYLYRELPTLVMSLTESQHHPSLSPVHQVYFLYTFQRV